MTICKQTKCLTCACFSGSGIRLYPLCRTPWCDACDPTTCTRLYNHSKTHRMARQDASINSLITACKTKWFSRCAISSAFRFQQKRFGILGNEAANKKPACLDSVPQVDAPEFWQGLEFNHRLRRRTHVVCDHVGWPTALLRMPRSRRSVSA